jgi:hypothetical protein
MAKQSKGRLVRLHVVLPGYAADQQTGEVPAIVEISNDDKEMRIIMDCRNYSALFQIPELRRVVAKILRMTGYEKL